jgi:hypothetical protein
MSDFVIPGPSKARSPESISTVGAVFAQIGIMDPGQPLRGFRDDALKERIT